MILRSLHCPWPGPQPFPQALLTGHRFAPSLPASLEGNRAGASQPGAGHTAAGLRPHWCVPWPWVRCAWLGPVGSSLNHPVLLLPRTGCDLGPVSVFQHPLRRCRGRTRPGHGVPDPRCGQPFPPGSPAGRRSWACRRRARAPPAACRRAPRGSGACWRPQGPCPVWPRCSFLQRGGLGSGWGLVCQDRLEMPLQFLRGHPTSPSSELSQPLPAPPPLATRARLSLPHLHPGPRPATPLSTLPEGTALRPARVSRWLKSAGLHELSEGGWDGPVLPGDPKPYPQPFGTV